jgi:hypothetical protein
VSSVIAAACIASAQIEILEVVDDNVVLVEGDTTTGSNPPDPVIAADGENLLVVVNSMIAVYDRDDLGSDPKTKQLWQFFGVDESDEPFDVSVVWDPGSNPPMSGRFVVSAIRPSPKRLLVAYSDRGVLDSDDPLNANDWTVVLNDTNFTDATCGGNGETLFVDQTSVGITESHWWVASFISGNTFFTDHTDLVFMSIDKSTGAVVNHRSSSFADGAGTLGCLSWDDVNTNGRAVARILVPPRLKVLRPPSTCVANFAQGCDSPPSSFASSYLRPEGAHEGSCRSRPRQRA